MKRFTCRLALLFLLTSTGVASAAAPIPAGKATAYPTELPVLSNAMLVVQVNGFEKTKGKINTFLKAALPKVSEVASKKLDEFIQSSLDGRELKGVTKDGRLYFAVHDFMNAQEGISFAIPCDDSKEFLDGFFPKDKVTSREKKAGFEAIESDGQTFYTIERPSYLVLTMSEELANEYAKKFDGLKSKSMGDTAETFFQSDVSLFFNIEQINQVHGEQIKAFQGFFNQALDQAAQAGQAAAMGMDRRQLEMTRYVYSGIFQMAEDGKTIAMGLEIKPDGVSLRAKCVFKPNSASGKLLALETPIKQDAVSDLPNGSMFYMGSSIGPGLMKIASKLNREYSAAESDETGAKLLADWMALQAAATSAVAVGEIGKSSVVISKNTEAQKTVDAYAKAMKSLGEGGMYQNIKLKGKPTVTEKAETHRGFTFHRATFQLDYEETFKAFPEEVRKTMIEAVKRINPGTMIFWMGAKEGQTMQVFAKDWATAKTAIDEALDSKQKIGANASAKTTLAMLPNECSHLSLFEAGKGLNFLGDYFSTVMSAIAMTGIAELPKLKPVNSEPTFVGTAMVCKGNSASMEMFVPNKAITDVYEMIAPLLDHKDKE